MSTPRTTFTRELIPGLALLAAGLLPQVAGAQALDEQYFINLRDKCARMYFDRDSNQNLLPGQAGPRLDAFCSGPWASPSGGGESGNASTGVSATAGVAAEAATRRRAAGDREKDAAATADEATLFSDGRNSIFASLNYAREEQDPMRFEDGHRAYALGLTLGADRRLGTTGIVGIAAQFENLSGDLDAGGDFENNAYGATLFGSWLPLPEVFIDVTGGWTARSADTHRRVLFEHFFVPLVLRSDGVLVPDGTPIRIEYIPPALASSNTDQQDLLAEMRTGYDFVSGGYAVGPRLAASWRRTHIDATAESDDTPMALAIGGQAEKSLRSGAGLQASRVFNSRSAVWVLQLNGDWWHEFQDNQRTIAAHLVEDLRASPTSFSYQNQPPDRDNYTARISLSSTMPHGWSAFASVDALLGHAYLSRYGAALGLRKEL